MLKLRKREVEDGLLMVDCKGKKCKVNMDKDDFFDIEFGINIVFVCLDN